MILTVGTISAGTTFKLYKNFYIKTTLVQQKTGKCYCCNLKTGDLETFTGTEKVVLSYIYANETDTDQMCIAEGSSLMTKQSLFEIAEEIKNSLDKKE